MKASLGTEKQIVKNTPNLYAICSSFSIVVYTIWQTWTILLFNDGRKAHYPFFKSASFHILHIIIYKLTCNLSKLWSHYFLRFSSPFFSLFWWTQNGFPIEQYGSLQYTCTYSSSADLYLHHKLMMMGVL